MFFLKVALYFIHHIIIISSMLSLDEVVIWQLVSHIILYMFSQMFNSNASSGVIGRTLSANGSCEG